MGGVFFHAFSLAASSFYSITRSLSSSLLFPFYTYSVCIETIEERNMCVRAVVYALAKWNEMPWKWNERKEKKRRYRPMKLHSACMLLVSMSYSYIICCLHRQTVKWKTVHVQGSEKLFLFLALAISNILAERIANIFMSIVFIVVIMVISVVLYLMPTIQLDIQINFISNAVWNLDAIGVEYRDNSHPFPPTNEWRSWDCV